MKNTTLNWEQLIRLIASMKERGATDEQISKSCSENLYLLEGKVQKIKLESEYNPGLEVAMPSIYVPLKYGLSVGARYLYLNVDKEDIDAWQSIEESQKISFTVSIVEMKGPFSGISFADEDDSSIEILFTTKSAKLVS